MLDKSLEIPEPPRPKTLLTGISGVSPGYVARVADNLRKLGIAVEVEVTGKKLPTAIEFAVKHGMKFIVIVGEKEEKGEKISIRNLETRTQVEVGLKDVKKIMEVFERA